MPDAAVVFPTYQPNTPRVPPNQHSVQLYSDDAYLIDGLCRFVGDALGAGDGAIVIATDSHQRQLEKRLASRGLAPSRAAAQGRYLTIDAEEYLPQIMVKNSLDEDGFRQMASSALSKVQSAFGGSNRRIAVFGELVALLWAQGRPQEALRLEELWNQLADQYAFSLLCAYPAAGFNRQDHIELFLKMCGQHHGIIPSSRHMELTIDESRLRTIAELQQKTEQLQKQRQGEQQFRLLVEAVQDYAIFMLDPAGNIRTWNIGAERIKQYKASEIIGRHFSCFYPEEDVRNGKPNWELVIAADEGRFEDEGWRLRKDGSRFWANVLITALRNESGVLVGYAKVTRDFTEKMKTQLALQKEVAERRDAERQLHISEKSLRQLSLHLLRTQDEERKRIGRDLHDSLGQYLAVLKMKLESLTSSLATEKYATEELAHCIQLTDDSIKEVRTVSYLLYPPMLEERGLRSAIPWYLDGFSARSGIETTFEAAPDFGRLPRDSELALFRVLQESLTNVHRHSESQTAHVRLLIRDKLGLLQVEDRGKGISSDLVEQYNQGWMGAPGVGLRGMSERMRQLGGTLDLISSEQGTTVIAKVPANS